MRQSLMTGDEKPEQGARLLNLQAHVDILKHSLNDAYAKSQSG